MDFDYSPEVQARRLRLEHFIDRYVLPYNAAWHRSVAQGVYPPPFLEDLKALAKAEGLWNLFLPGLRDDEPGERLSNLAYAPLAEIMGRHVEYTEANGRPLVKAYTRAEAMRLFGGFSDCEIEVNQLTRRDLRPIGQLIPEALFQWLARHFGWNLLITATK